MDYFPYEYIRPIQHELIEDIYTAIENKKNIICHAPTGLGKTVSSIAPAIEFAIKNDLKIFFLTSRHTQHKIVIETLKSIKDKFALRFSVVDLIGKKMLCSVPGIENLYHNDFISYCKAMREDDKCDFYNNTKLSGKLSVSTKLMLENLNDEIYHVDEFVDRCKAEELCAYEVLVEASKKARVIVCDYYYIFNETVRKSFFSKTSIELDKCIIIVDEGHNLPQRIRDLMTVRLSTNVVNRAITECHKYRFADTVDKLENIKQIMQKLAGNVADNNEKKIGKEDLMLPISTFCNTENLIEEFANVADEIREITKQSYTGSVANFFGSWQGDDYGYTRILKVEPSKTEKNVIISYGCLDPSLITKKIIDQAHSVILMSGTLTPTFMYKDILGFPESSVVKSYKSPFPNKNRLNLIIPETSTKYSQRSSEQYGKIASIVLGIVKEIPGNIAVFFPSYYIRDQVYPIIRDRIEKTLFLEVPELTSAEKTELLEKFKKYKDSGAVLLGVAGGSFSEGIDLPGDLLQGVIIVGVPLTQPNLETKELIEYYDLKFNKGWDYGYIYPALNKVMQAAGRCIRSETDKGVIVFIDERYSWNNYLKCFPNDWDIIITRDFLSKIKSFFNK